MFPGVTISAGTIATRDVGGFEVVSGNPAELFGNAKKLDERLLEDQQLSRFRQGTGAACVRLPQRAASRHRLRRQALRKAVDRGVHGRGEERDEEGKRIVSELRVGIVGIGDAGRAHMRRFEREGRARVTSIFDTKQTGKYGGVPIEGDLASFLSKVDAISVCAPDMDHLEYCGTGLRANKHVLVEKPMVGSLDQVEKLRQVVEAKPELVFAVHHQMRAVPAFLRSKQILKERSLEPVFQVEANYWHDMRERATSFDDWRVSGRGQSVLFGAACHPLDLLVLAAVINLGYRAIERLASDSPRFRRPPFSRYTHEIACRRIIQNFVSATYGEEDVLVLFDQAYKVVQIMEKMEAQAMKQYRGEKETA